MCKVNNWWFVNIGFCGIFVKFEIIVIFGKWNLKKKYVVILYLLECLVYNRYVLIGSRCDSL